MALVLGQFFLFVDQYLARFQIYDSLLVEVLILVDYASFVHRLREGFKVERTACINRIRGLLAEFGVVFSQSPAVLRQALPDALEDATNELGGLARLATVAGARRACQLV